MANDVVPGLDREVGYRRVNRTCCKIGKAAPARRSAKSKSVAASLVGRRSGLRHHRETTKNVFIEGDNLEVLKPAAIRPDPRLRTCRRQQVANVGRHTERGELGLDRMSQGMGEEVGDASFVANLRCSSTPSST
jgi:hypothetical protein